MIWRRTFQSLYEEICSRDVPRPLLLKPIAPIICSKRSWSLAFDEQLLAPTLVFLEEEDEHESIPVEADNVEAPQVTEEINMDAVVLPNPIIFKASTVGTSTKRKGRKAATPIVDTQVRRCTRSAIRRDDFKSEVLVERSTPPRKKRPRTKPLPQVKQTISEEEAQ